MVTECLVTANNISIMQSGRYNPCLAWLWNNNMCDVVSTDIFSCEVCMNYPMLPYTDPVRFYLVHIKGENIMQASRLTLYRTRIVLLEHRSIAGHSIYGDIRCLVPSHQAEGSCDFSPSGHCAQCLLNRDNHPDGYPLFIITTVAELDRDW